MSSRENVRCTPRRLVHRAKTDDSSPHTHTQTRAHIHYMSPMKNCKLQTIQCRPALHAPCSYARSTAARWGLPPVAAAAASPVPTGPLPSAMLPSRLLPTGPLLSPLMDPSSDSVAS